MLLLSQYTIRSKYNILQSFAHIHEIVLGVTGKVLYSYSYSEFFNRVVLSGRGQSLYESRNRPRRTVGLPRATMKRCVNKNLKAFPPSYINRYDHGHTCHSYQCRRLCSQVASYRWKDGSMERRTDIYT